MAESLEAALRRTAPGVLAAEAKGLPRGLLEELGENPAAALEERSLRTERAERK